MDLGGLFTGVLFLGLSDWEGHDKGSAFAEFTHGLDGSFMPVGDAAADGQAGRGRGTRGAFC